MTLGPIARRAILAGAYALFAAASLWLFLSHQILPDEGQAWLWAIELSDLPTFFAVPGEGHPPLWFATLKLISLFLEFSQARWFTFALTLLNGMLILRLFKQQFWLALALILSSITVLYWGVLFRPYTLVFTIVLLAMLSETAGRWRLAGWLLALATGFHFYVNVLFGFWLLVSLGRRRDWRQVVGPTMMASLFAVSALVSGQGNAATGFQTDAFFAQFFSNLIGGFGMASPFAPLVVLPIAAWLGLTFQKDRLVLVVLGTKLVLFTLFTALVYGFEPWHLAFITLLVVLAAVMARPLPDDWRIVLLILPWIWTSGYALTASINSTNDGLVAAFDAVAADAENSGQLLTPQNLVVWPDYMFAALSAQNNFRYTSGNNGAELGPVNWRTRDSADISTAALARWSHYWLVCATCENVIPVLQEIGAATEILFATEMPTGEPLIVFRVTLPTQSGDGE